MKVKSICLPLLLSVVAVFGWAQDSKSDIAISGTGVFTKGSSGSGIDQTVTKSVGFLATYRYSFTDHQAVELNYGHNTSSQRYLDSSDYLTELRGGIHELTANYVLKSANQRFSPFALMGTGALIFNPSSDVVSNYGASAQARAAFVYGAGADYNLAKSFGIRLQYRGLVYKAPDFNLSTYKTNVVTHSAEPSIGLVFHF